VTTRNGARRTHAHFADSRRRVAAGARRTSGGLFALVGLAACSPASPASPEPRSVEATVSNPFEIELSHPLRYTTVWTAGSLSRPEYHLVGGGSVSAGTGTFQVELRMPSPDLASRLVPKTDLYLSTQSSGVTLYRLVETHRPRVVVFEDVNDNERLDLKQNATADPDRVLAIDEGYYTMTAVLDLEELLRELPTPLVDLYYSVTGGRFTPFIPSTGTTDYLYPGDKSFAYDFSLEDAGSALASLRCLRSLSYAQSTSSPSVVLDAALDPALCGLDYGNCRSQALEELTPPDVDPIRTSAHRRQAACRRRGSLEVLAISEARFSCERCACRSAQQLRVLIAAREAVPSWWPCGDEIAYCKSEASLTTFPVACVGVEDPDGG